MSGVVPLVAAHDGPGRRRHRLHPGPRRLRADGRGPRLDGARRRRRWSRRSPARTITEEELGGAKIHCRKSGVGDLEVADDAECIEAIKQYLSFFPTNCEQQAADPPTTDPIDRRDEELLDIVPESPRQPYDMYEVIKRIVDDGEYFDIKPKWAKTIITCFARIGGRPVGIVASSPSSSAASSRTTRPTRRRASSSSATPSTSRWCSCRTCRASWSARRSSTRASSATAPRCSTRSSRATVPKITVVIRKAYGAGYYVMCGTRLRARPDRRAGRARRSRVMGAEGAVNIIFRKQIEAADDPEATRAQMVANFKEIIDPYIAAGNDMVDDIIDPRETRPTIIRALEMSAGQARRAALEEARRDAGVSDRDEQIRVEIVRWSFEAFDRGRASRRCARSTTAELDSPRWRMSRPERIRRFDRSIEVWRAHAASRGIGSARATGEFADVRELHWTHPSTDEIVGRSSSACEIRDGLMQGQRRCRDGSAWLSPAAGDGPAVRRRVQPRGLRRDVRRRATGCES